MTIAAPPEAVPSLMETPKLLEVKDLPRGSGWGTVPTPVF